MGAKGIADLIKEGSCLNLNLGHSIFTPLIPYSLTLSVVDQSRLPRGDALS
jgi:hypothetical protein